MKDPFLPQVLNSPKQGHIISKYQKNYFAAVLNRLETVKKGENYCWGIYNSPDLS